MARRSAERRRSVTRGTGNMFADLRFPDAAERQTKLRLAYALNQVLEPRQLSRAEAAKVLGVTQPQISALRHYKLAGFSVEQLMNLLAALDQDTEVVIRRKPPSRKAGRISVVAIVTACVLTGCNRPSTARNERDAALAANVEAFATKLAASDEFSGVVLLTRYGQPLVRRGYGLADRKVGRANTPETPFMLSSVSKMFTAVTIAKLVERKQLSFDSTLGSLLPEYPSAEARDRVTVRHLLTMSSGIPDLFRVPEFWAQVATTKSPVELWKYFATSPLQFRPGTQWSYSNSNFLLLGAIIERQTGRAFTSVVEAEIFRPLGLANTRYEVGGSPKPALGYTRTPPAGARADSARWFPAWEEPKPGDDCKSAPRWAVATRPQTTWPVLPTRSWVIGFSTGK